MKLISIFVLLTIMFIFPLAGQNLLQNPGMEENDTEATGWRLDEFLRGGTIVRIEHDGAFGGKNYVSLENTAENDARLIQTVKIEENANYRVSGWIKTENVSDEGIGANLSLNEHWFISREIKGTSDKWEYVEFYLSVTADLKTVTVCLRLGGYGGTSTGKACFDEVSMVKVKDVPGGDRAFTIGRSEKDNSQDRENRNRNTEESAAGTEDEHKPPADPREITSNIIVYSLVLLSVIVFCIQLIIVKPKPETER
ncbi:MAG: hypothetical protein JXB88_23120 [Spirochaetales bacterium]|nr:hypothetical protein [Spirochaetales bacterium]